MIKKTLPVLLLGCLMAGCSSMHVTNLTPQQEIRNPDGTYSIEVALASRQQTLRWRSIRPSVVVGHQIFPMQPTPLMTNRWETLVPIPLGQDVLHYRFKFDFDYNTFGSPGRSDSKLSQFYKLQIQ